jgi:RNA polymerase sigma factor (sigma-70 family)
LKTIADILASKHNKWISYCRSWGCNPDTSEDLVQEMYLKILVLIQNGIDISYKEDVNDFYIYKVLRSMFLDLCRKEKRTQVVDLTDEYIKYTIEEKGIAELDDHKIFEEAFDKVNKALNEMHWYDKKVFELVQDTGNISELSRNTAIEYRSLYNTYQKVKRKIKDKL